MGKFAYGLAAAALITLPFIASPASAADCSTDTITPVGTPAPNGAGTYTAQDCTAFGFLFTNITFGVTVLPTGTTSALVGLTGLSDVNPAPGEFGLALKYSATAGASTEADVSWTYNVTAPDAQLISDAFLALNATDTATGTTSSATETFSNRAPTLTVSCTGPSSSCTPPSASISENFSDGQLAHQLFITKDNGNTNFATSGIAQSSVLVNAFSVTAVPAPIVGAGLPGLLAACGGLIALARRRRRSAA